MSGNWSLVSEALHGELWRLWTGHLVHYGAAHLLLNVAAAAAPLAVLRRSVPQVLLWSLVSAPVISVIALAASAGPMEYRGASALVTGLWVAAAIELWREQHRRLLAFAILGLVATKLVVETTVSSSLLALEVPPLPVAHWSGAILGAAFRLLPVKSMRALGRDATAPQSCRPTDAATRA